MDTGRIDALALAAALRLNVPSGRVLLALLPLLAVLLGLIIYCLIDLVRAPSVRYLPKPAWALVIVLLSAPLGAIAYLVLGRNPHDDRTGRPAPHGAGSRDDHAAVR